MAEIELFGTASCPYTEEARESLEWKRVDFVEYDVERDAEARRRFERLVEAPRMVPVLVKDGRVIQVGWQGRGCVVGA